jgi:ppGpp synthetase/RelA/SpoT-type nucleotidyltranferase
MPRNRRAVFISSTSTDLEVERAAAIAALNRLSMVPIAMEYFQADRRQPSEVIADRLGESDAVLLMIGSRLGSKLPDSNKYFLELEYEIALSRRLPLYVLTPHEDRRTTARQVASSSRERKALQDFIKRLEQTHTVRKWRSAPDITAEIISIFSQPESFRLPAANDKSPIALSKEVALRKTHRPRTAAVARVGLLLDQHRDLLLQEVKKLVHEKFFETAARDFLVESRTKTFESLTEKLTRPSNFGKYNHLSDVTDLCGIRAIAYHQADIMALRDLLLHRFSGAALDEKSPHQSQLFGDRSIHIIVNLPVVIDGINLFRAEIQLRTFLQHTWAQIEHQLGYKDRNHDDESQRLFAQVAALLEVADGKFAEARARQVVQYQSGRMIGGPGLRERRKMEPAAVNDQWPSEMVISELTIAGYFESDAWRTSNLWQSVCNMPPPFGRIEATRAASAELEAIRSAMAEAGLTKMSELQEFFNRHDVRLAKAASTIYELHKHEEFSPLDLLWYVVLLATARLLTNDRAKQNRIELILEANGLFPEEDRERIAALFC